MPKSLIDIEFLDKDDQRRYQRVREEFYDLILRAAKGNETHARALMKKLDKANIKCIADFQCMHLLTMQRINGIGKVYGAIIAEMWRLRLMEIIEEATKQARRKKEATA